MRQRTIPIIALVLTLAASWPAARGADDKAQKSAAGQPVTVVEDEANFTLTNGVITAKVSKRSGDLVSLRYKGLELLGASGHAGGYWSHTASGPRSVASITIDPKTNGGERG